MITKGTKVRATFFNARTGNNDTAEGVVRDVCHNKATGEGSFWVQITTLGYYGKFIKVPIENVEVLP